MGMTPKRRHWNRKSKKGANLTATNIEPIANAEEVMRQVKADAVSVVSEEKKLIGKATRTAIEKERLKAESGKPRTDLKAQEKCGGL